MKDDTPHISKRREARITAMQALCQWDVQGESSSEGLCQFLNEVGARGDVASYALQIVEAYWKQSQLVDDAISNAALRWDFNRISLVERNVLRVAVVELFEAFAPPKVAISEAVEIGGAYAGADSPRFINGLLDAIYHKMNAEAGTEDIRSVTDVENLKDVRNKRSVEIEGEKDKK